MIPGAAFYCVADERYFLGAVAMINSLRLHGHREPVYLLDCGLRADQRRLLAGAAELLDAPGEAPAQLLKTIAPQAAPAEVMVLIDADMIVTRPLEELIEPARAGRVVAFENAEARHFSQWGELLGLGATRPGPYVSSGLVCCGGEPGAEVVALMDRCRDRVDFEATLWRSNQRQYPFLYADQDVLNAVLHSALEPQQLLALESRLAPNPPFRGLRALDQEAPACAYADGTRPFVLHHYLRKPWLDRVHSSVYSSLLARLLLAPGSAITPPAAAVPPRLRGGTRARVERALVDCKDFGRWHLGDRLPPWLGARVEGLRRRVSGGL